jgi:hypothetical protein
VIVQVPSSLLSADAPRLEAQRGPRKLPDSALRRGGIARRLGRARRRALFYLGQGVEAAQELR